VQRPYSGLTPAARRECFNNQFPRRDRPHDSSAYEGGFAKQFTPKAAEGDARETAFARSVGGIGFPVMTASIDCR